MTDQDNNIIEDSSIAAEDTLFYGDGTIWTERQFSHPERKIRLATSFSGIGAIEHAFQRLGLHTEIVFAGDIDEKCKRLYFANYDIDESRWHSDIHAFDASPFKGKVDILDFTGQ